ncbi:hypothetical protein B0H11DRAFT_781005 [Mycena galericulata]|nr:hypothetical protein B0H11DRAFT_781005 [Mycena galericulata]
MPDGGSLPDEIISEILSPALKVSEDIFSDTSEVSPFATYSESTSAYLLVCKSWLRVATPLLYNVVILRSKAQAKALSQALAKNQGLGQFIKKLRVEGGYGQSMHTVLKFAPNITDLFLSLAIWSSDNTAGLCMGLPLINPIRLIIRDSTSMTLNKMLSNLVNALVASMPKWDRLVIFHCDFLGGTWNADELVQPLSKSPILHTIIIPKVQGARWAYKAFKTCPLKVIKIQQPVEGRDRIYLPWDEKEALKLLKFTNKDTPAARVRLDQSYHIARPLNPHFIPMNAASQEDRDAIWSRILYFAMSVTDLANDPRRKEIPRRLPMLSVSKTFNRLGLPHYYTHVILKDLNISKFASVLYNNPSLGPHVRTIWVASKNWRVMDSMLPILLKTTGLERMHTLHSWFPNEEHQKSSFHSEDSQIFSLPSEQQPIPWYAFTAMARCSGSTLRELSYPVQEPIGGLGTAKIFDALTELRSLHWKCQTRFVCPPEDTPSEGLLNLEELQVWSSDSSFFAVLSRMELKSLRRLGLASEGAEQFLKMHGKKLTELDIAYTAVDELEVKIFEVSPNLCSISLFSDISRNPPIEDHFHPAQPVPSVLKITFDLPEQPLDKHSIAHWETYLTILFEPKCFPGLRQIQVRCFEWPTNEREISKSCWVRWAESMLKYNISLTDRTGKRWRPRLKMK